MLDLTNSGLPARQMHEFSPLKKYYRPEMRVIRVDDSYDEQLRSLMDMTALGAGPNEQEQSSEGEI